MGPLNPSTEGQTYQCLQRPYLAYVIHNCVTSSRLLPSVELRPTSSSHRATRVLGLQHPSLGRGRWLKVRDRSFLRPAPEINTRWDHPPELGTRIWIRPKDSPCYSPRGQRPRSYWARASSFRRTSSRRHYWRRPHGLRYWTGRKYWCSISLIAWRSNSSTSW